MRGKSKDPFIMHGMKRPMAKKWKEEKGSSMLAVFFALVIFAIFISFFFFDLFNIFIGKRMNQTAADAASIAAVKEAARVATAALEGDIGKKIGELNDYIDAKAKEIANERCQEHKGDTCDWTAFYIQAWEELLKDYCVPPSIAAHLDKNPKFNSSETPEIPIQEAVTYFYPIKNSCSPVTDPPEKVREIFDETISRSLEGSIHAEAERYAKENAAEVAEIEYSRDDYAISVLTKRKVRFQTVDENQIGREPAVSGKAKAAIQKIIEIKDYYSLR